MHNPEQCYIIQGVRGAGKTTLLTRLAIEIEEHESLHKWLIPVQFKEEEYGISNLFSFWLRVATDLEENQQFNLNFQGLVDDMEAINVVETEDGDSEDARMAFKLLNNRLEASNKKVILLIDNIAELFDGFTETETAILREILSQNLNIRIIGGSAIPLESFYDHKNPFYQFFKVLTLKNLTKKETLNLLKTLGKVIGGQAQQNIEQVIEQQPEKIESIRRLTGGVPRTIVLLFEVLAEGPKGSSFQYLDDTLDMASPIYKHRMDDLSSQQKPIVHAIAMHWDAISAKEIAAKTRISSKTVSAQLAQLQKQWIIEKVPTTNKNHLYRIQERFFNIWYLMRYGRRHDKTKLRWLTNFLEVWCTADDLSSHAQRFVSELQGEAYLPGTLAFASALIQSNVLKLADKEAIYNNATEFFKQQGESELLKELPDIGGSEYTDEAFRLLSDVGRGRIESEQKAYHY